MLHQLHGHSHLCLPHAEDTRAHRVLEDPTSPMPVGGYMVACVVFYEQGFSVPSQ
jgi:hypothetical protein